MTQNTCNRRREVRVSKLPKMVLFALILMVSSTSFAQTAGVENLPKARMMHDNTVTIRTGLFDTYRISISHFGFSSVDEAKSYFEERDVDNIEFVVVNATTVILKLELNNPSVDGWTLDDWNQLLIDRASSVEPREINY